MNHKTNVASRSSVSNCIHHNLRQLLYEYRTNLRNSLIIHSSYCLGTRQYKKMIPRIIFIYRYYPKSYFGLICEVCQNVCQDCVSSRRTWTWYPPTLRGQGVQRNNVNITRLKCVARQSLASPVILLTHSPVKRTHGFLI